MQANNSLRKPFYKTDVVPSLPGEGQESDGKESKKKSNRSKMIQCYECGKRGHGKKECPTLFCKTCLKLGHTYKKCPSYVTSCKTCSKGLHPPFQCPEIECK